MSKSVTFRTLGYYLDVAKQYKWAIIVNFIFPAVGVIFGVTVFRYFLAVLIERLSGFGGKFDSSDIFQIFWILIGVQIVEVACWRINDFTLTLRQAKTFRELEQFVFNKLKKHSYRFFSDNFAGSLVTKFNRFVQSYLYLEQIFFLELYTTFVIIISSIIFLAFVSPLMSIVMLIWTALFLISVIFLTIKKSPATRAESSADSRVTAELADTLTNIINVKTFAQDRYEQSRFNKVSNERYVKRRRSWMLDLHIRSYRWFMVIVFIFAYLYLSIYLVVNGYASVSIVLAAQLYMIAIYQNLFNLNQTIMRIGQHLSEAVEMTEILDESHEVIDSEHPEPIKMTEGKIDFKDVRFRYAEAGQDVFSQLDLTIKPGEKVGLVGHSGSGKTTLTRLLLRFLDIDEGTIEIDGQDIALVKQEDLRSHIAYVPQEPILFHRSLMDNIRYGRLDATDEEIYEAAKNANAAEFIDQLPKKYDTLVGERGMKLSGGQKQRVAIARAMMVKAPILLLDEATSALDSKSEKLIADALDNLMKNRTTIVIAHRLSTIRKLDRILVMRDGSIVEDGKHDELMKQNGVYAELWRHQSGDFLED